MLAMPEATRQSQARDQINMRVPLKERELIDRAAEASGKTRSDFMLDAARQAAEAVLLDRRMFLMDESDYRKFVDLLDAPPERNEKLRELLATEAPWKE